MEKNVFLNIFITPVSFKNLRFRLAYFLRDYNKVAKTLFKNN